MRSDLCVVHWEGEELEIAPGVTLVRVGGHFAGSTVLHWRDGASGRGSLHTGDSIYVVADKSWVSFMYSYPNLIPLAPEAVRRIVLSLKGFEFERIYGAWWDSVVGSDAKRVLGASAERYIAAIKGEAPAP